MPVIAQHAAEGLKPERVRKVAQHLLSAKLRYRSDGNLTCKLRHPPEQPRRHLAIMQRQIGNPRPLSRASHLPFRVYYTVEQSALAVVSQITLSALGIDV